MLSIMLAAVSTAAAGSSFFPAYRDFAGQPFAVDFSPRAITLNGQPSLFLSGSVHPPRLSVQEWDVVFANMVASGLNMVEVCVWQPCAVHLPTTPTRPSRRRRTLQVHVLELP